MKQVLAFMILAAAPIVAAGDGTLNETERMFLVEQLEQSKRDMIASITGLTEAQWKFKPAPNVWSVAECAEHIVLSENFLSGAARQVLKTPAVERPETSNSEADHKLVAGVADRSKKAKAPEPIVPSGKLATPDDAIKAFTEARDNNIMYAKSTTDDLRVHVMKNSPLGTLDAYQVLLLMAGHSVRHTAQIREVEANNDYPKSTAGVQRH